MKIHEYQAKQIFAQYQIPIPKGAPATTIAEAQEVIEKLISQGVSRFVVKAQIHAGGRGKGGGVKLAKNENEALAAAKSILGMKLVTHQTGAEGKLVQRILIEEAKDIEKELYFGITLDRKLEKPVILASEAGGVEIEEVAAHTPEKIITSTIEPSLGLKSFQARQLAFKLGLQGEQIKTATKMFQNLWQIFWDKDASLVEINPLVITKSGDLLALDAKINFDDCGLYRHPEVVEMRDLNEENPAEVEASKFKLSYIKLEGNIGCMVNGAGLAMSTMDIILLAGGQPANFLDVGGGATEEQIKNAFRILLLDKAVKSVMINIFGGILRCDTLATGIVKALKELTIDVPIVVRMKGTNVEKGQEILKSSGLNFTTAATMKEAAQKAVELAGAA